MIVLGTLNRFLKDNNTIVSRVSSIDYLPGFNVDTMKDDIAIVFLSTGLPDTIINSTHPSISPIELSNSNLKPGSTCQITGWGKTENVIII